VLYNQEIETPMEDRGRHNWHFSFQSPSRSQEPERKTQKNFEPAAGEQISRYKFYLRAQTRLKPRRKLKHAMFQFPSQSRSQGGLLTIENNRAVPRSDVACPRSAGGGG
jgi:hypothetical protein